MMKNKIIMTILIIAMILTIGTISSFAEGEANIELNLNGQTTVNKDTKTVELTLSLGDFTGVEAGATLGYQATLEFDENMFQSVEVEGFNGWTANYESSTKVLLGDVDRANPNTDITKITLTLKDDVQPGTEGKVQINNILLTDGNNDFTFNKEVTVKMEEEVTTPVEDDNTNNSGNNGNATNNNSSINANISNNAGMQSENTDNTTVQATRLPNTGIENIILVAIAVTIVAIIVFKIKSRDIKY